MTIKYFIFLLYIIMDSFQIIVLVVATVLLIIIFATIGIVTKYYSTENVVFPPVANTCPDTWEVDPSGCKIPNSNSVNVGTIYNATALVLKNKSGDEKFDSAIHTPGYDSANQRIDFTDSASWGYSSKSPICNKSAWAKKYSITWDGVSNVIGCK